MPKTFHCADTAKLCHCSGFEQCAECRNEGGIDPDFDAVSGREISDALGAALVSSVAQIIRTR